MHGSPGLPLPSIAPKIEVLALSGEYCIDPQSKNNKKNKELGSVRESILTDLGTFNHYLKVASSTMNYVIAAGAVRWWVCC